MFDVLEKIIKKYNVRTLISYLRKIKILLNEKHVSVAVLGGFKVGKSSFLNAIIEQNILPVGVLPTTNVITKVIHDSVFRIVIVTEDNTFEISKKAISEYLTEKQNPDNQKKVKEVNLFVPGIEDIKDVELIDTPGIGSFFTQNTETTMNWTPESTFIIYAINPQQPFSVQDVQNIKEILTYTDKISLLLTKVDLLSPDERVEMTDYINQVAKHEFNRLFPLYFFSTKENTANYISIIKQKLFLPLVLRKQENLNELIAYKTTKLKESLRQYLQLLLETRQQEQSTIEQLRNELISEQEFLRQVHRELGFIAKEYMAHTREELDKLVFETSKKELTKILREKFADSYLKWHGNLYKRTRQFEKWLRDNLNDSLKQIFDNIRNEVENLTMQPQKHFERQVFLYRERMNNRIEPVLHQVLPTFLWQITPPEITQPDIAVSWTFDSNIDLLWWLFPMPLWKKFFGRYFQKKIPAEVEKNLHRLISQITQKVNISIISMQELVRDYLAEEHRQVLQMLDSKHVETDEIKKDLKLLNK